MSNAPGSTSHGAALLGCSVAGKASTHRMSPLPVPYFLWRLRLPSHKAPKLTFLYFLFILPLAFYRGAHRDGGHGTSYSEKYFDGNRPAAMYNKNVEWLRYAHFWWLYLGFVAFFVTLLRLTILSKAEDLGMVLTVAHVVHNLVSDREMGGGREGEREG